MKFYDLPNKITEIIKVKVDNMSILDKIKGALEEKAKKFLMEVALKKGVKAAVQVLVGLIGAHAAIAQDFGVTVIMDPDKLLAALTVFVLEVVRNFLKRKFPGLFGSL